MHEITPQCIPLAQWKPQGGSLKDQETDINLVLLQSRSFSSEKPSVLELDVVYVT